MLTLATASRTLFPAGLVAVLATLPVVRAQDPALEIHTDDTRAAFASNQGLPQLVKLSGPDEDENWLIPASEAVLPETVEIDGSNHDVAWQFAGASRVDGFIEFAYESARPKLSARSTWTAKPGPGPVEHEVALVNSGDKPIVFRFPPTIATAVRLQENRTLKNWWVHKGAGHMPHDGGTYAEEVSPDYARTLRSGPYSEDGENRDAIPWFALQDAENKRGLYGGVEFSGWVEINLCRKAGRTEPEQNDAAQTADRIALTLGMMTDEEHGRTRLAPGQTYRYPTCFLGCYAGDVDDGCNRLHRWVERHIRPPMPWGVTPILVNNSWGSEMAIDEGLARKMIDDCAELGMEHFQVDAGWYRDLGDWRTDPEKFPNGLGPVADYARSKGVKFGVWFAWTQAGAARTSDPNILSVHNPAQRTWFGRDMPLDWKNQPYIGEPVCLGSPQARAWCLAELRRIVKEAKLDLLEHDQDMIQDECIREDHDHLPGDRVDASRASAEGYYAIYDQLRRENPRLLFENCVNGGRLVDFGVAKCVHYICVTDVYDPQTCRRAFYDSSYPLPPGMCELYIEHKPGETLASFTTMLRSATIGWATIMINAGRWTPEQRAIAQREFAVYKERLRPLIASGNLYHILPRPKTGRWDGIQYCDPATGRGAAFVFRAHSADDNQTVKLRGLDPDVRYAIRSVDDTTPEQSRTGRELMDSGLPLTIADEDGSELLLLSTLQ